MKRVSRVRISSSYVRRPCATSGSVLYHHQMHTRPLPQPPPYRIIRNNQRNLVMSCVTWQNKSISCRGLQKIARQKSKSKFIEKYVKHAPLPPNTLPLTEAAAPATTPYANYVKVLFRSRFICFLRRNLKDKLFDM